jgi:hypothetical protein
VDSFLLVVDAGRSGVEVALKRCIILEIETASEDQHEWMVMASRLAKLVFDQEDVLSVNADLVDGDKKITIGAGDERWRE